MSWLTDRLAAGGFENADTGFESAYSLWFEKRSGHGMVRVCVEAHVRADASTVIIHRFFPQALNWTVELHAAPRHVVEMNIEMAAGELDVRTCAWCGTAQPAYLMERISRGKSLACIDVRECLIRSAPESANLSGVPDRDCCPTQPNKPHAEWCDAA